jgi:hypothetical protein
LHRNYHNVQTADKTADIGWNEHHLLGETTSSSQKSRRKRFGFTNREIRFQKEKWDDKKHSERKEVRMMEGLEI